MPKGAESGDLQGFPIIAVSGNWSTNDYHADDAALTHRSNAEFVSCGRCVMPMVSPDELRRISEVYWRGS